MANSTAAYPSHQVSIRAKNYEWVLAYVKAIWQDATGLPKGFWYTGNNTKYDEKKWYGMGKQPIDRYKKGKKATDISDNTGATVDNSPIAIISKFVEIINSILYQRKYSLSASVVDSLSKTEEDTELNKRRIKLMMREEIQRMGSSLANSPLLKPQDGEPEDMEQLNMQRDFSYKHIMAQKAEIAIQYINQLNNMDNLRLKVIRDLVDIGFSGYRTWVDEKGLVRERDVKAKNIIPSFCVEPDFSDMTHCGEIKMVFVADLTPYFKPEQIQKICERYATRYGNPDRFIGAGQKGYNANRFKVPVFDVEFFSWNTNVHEDTEDTLGNRSLRKSDYSNIKYVTKSNTSVLPDGSIETIPSVDEKDKGEATGVYAGTTRKVVYSAKWIPETDMMYDWGLMKNQPRKESMWQETQLSFHLRAWNFYEMMFGGLTERLIPIADAYQKTWKKLQEMKNSLIPYLIKLDLDQLEAVAIGKGGVNMTPMELVDFLFANGVILWRSSGGIGQGINNYNPASIEASGQLIAFTQLYQDLTDNIQKMYEISGLNETSASSPDPKQNQLGINASLQNTNNALFLISEADKALQLQVAEAVILKLQCAVQMGKVEGYVKALGKETIEFLQLDETFSLPEFGISIEDLPTQEERQMLYQRMIQADGQGILDPSDWIIIERVSNLDEAAQFLSYKIKKGKEQAQQNDLQKIKMQTDGNTQTAQATAQAQQQIIMLTHQLKMQEIAAEAQANYLIEEMKKGHDVTSAQIQSQGRIIQQQIIANAKLATSQPK